MYQTKLDIEGYEIDAAENGTQGVEKAKSFLPDLILLDILMPELDGFGVLDALKHDELTKDIPVIMMSNLGQDEHVKKAISMGARDYIVKSQFTPSSVVEKIKEVLVKGHPDSAS
jgi:DNA-binding response OmpR family regulator